MDINKLRELFPVTEDYIFLNNAAESPLNKRVEKRLNDYLHLAANAPHLKPGDIREEVRYRLANLFGGSAEEYALITSTGVGVGLIASGYPWQEGDNIVVPADEHWSNTFPWLNLKSKGVTVHQVPLDANNRVDFEKIEELVNQKTRILAAAAVRFNSGYRSDLKRLSQIAKKHKALFLVDGIQAAGAVPIDVEADGIDILSSAGFKWLLGLPGTGFLYINKDAQNKIKPLLPGMFAAENSFTQLKFYDDARRFETGTIPYSLFHAWTAGLDLLEEIGIENIHKRVLYLTDLLIEGLKEKGYELLTPTEKEEERSAILVFSLGSRQKNKELYKSLLAKNIIITYRGDSLRVSPSFYNTEADIETFLQAI